MIPNSKPPDRDRSLLFGSFFFEKETLLYVLLSAADLFVTYYLLQQEIEHGQFVESNPVARYFLDGWGIRGMIYFKFGMVAVVCVLTQLIARWRPRTARLVLIFAIVVVTYVLVYSVRLYRTHAGDAGTVGESFHSPIPDDRQIAKLNPTMGITVIKRRATGEFSEEFRSR